MAKRRRPGALVVLPTPMFIGSAGGSPSWLASDRLPAIYDARTYVDAGGLMSYGAKLS